MNWMDLNKKPIATADTKTTETPATPAVPTPSTENDTNEQTTSKATPAIPTANTATNTSEATPSATKLPATTTALSPDTADYWRDYLANGFCKGEGKGRYPDPALVDYAEVIGKGLAAGGVTPTAFNRMVKTLKDAKKLSFDAQQGALKRLMPLVLKEKKAPPLLREVVERNKEAVQTEADFAVCLEHFQHIATYLSTNTVKKK